MKHCNIAAWGEYQEMVQAGVFYTPDVPDYIPELFDRLQQEAGVVLAKDAEELLGKQLWVLQATAELANMMAKAVDEDFYEIKDWLLVEITRQYFGHSSLAIRASWNMAELEVSTAEWGVSSYHTFQHMDAWYELPYAGEWCGIKRQFNALQALKDPRLMAFLARVTLRAKAGMLHYQLHERINNLLDGWGETYPLP